MTSESVIVFTGHELHVANAICLRPVSFPPHLEVGEALRSICTGNQLYIFKYCIVTSSTIALGDCAERKEGLREAMLPSRLSRIEA